MKLKKILFSISSLILIFVIIALSILISNKTTPITILLGNPLTTNITYDDTFTSSYMDCALLNKMLSNDARKIKNEKVIKISKLIENSSTILINIGQVDLTNKITYDTSKQEFIYQNDLINRQVELCTSLMKNILSQILMLNKHASIIIYSIPYPYSTLNSTIQTYFECLNNHFSNLSNINEKITFNK